MDRPHIFSEWALPNFSCAFWMIHRVRGWKVSHRPDPAFPFTATHITIIAAVPNHLIALIWNVWAHSGEPFKRVKDLLLFPILGLVNNLGLFRDICHSLLEERGTDDMPSDVFHGLFISRLNSWPTIYVEAWITPRRQHVNEVFSDLTFGKEHFEDLMAEDLFHILEFKGGWDLEHALTIKTAVWTYNVKMRIESEKITERLYCDNGSGHCVFFVNGTWDPFLFKDCIQRTAIRVLVYDL